MKEELELIERLNTDYYNRTGDSFCQFYIEGNEFFCIIKFGDIVLYNSEEDSLITGDGKDMSILECMNRNWDDYKKFIPKTNPF